jgi:hypothetical protein
MESSAGVRFKHRFKFMDLLPRKFESSEGKMPFFDYLK